MKILNFTAVEILPALLSKAKTQTIRPAFITNPYSKLTSEDIAAELHTNGVKPPRFKVGDEVKLLWQQRSKYKLFCQKCLKGIPYPEITVGCPTCIFKLPEDEGLLKPFNKLLGTAEITEVFKISIWKNKVKHRQESFDGYNCEVLGTIEEWAQAIKDEWIINLAKLDGFNSAEQMFSYFDNKYDLSQPKAFWVYRWRWLS